MGGPVSYNWPVLLPTHPPLLRSVAAGSSFCKADHSFLQSRSQFHLSFFIFGLLYLILDLELVLLYPFAMSTYENGKYGLTIMLIFTLIISIGFVYELCSGALQIESKQNNAVNKVVLVLSKLSPTGFGGIVLQSEIRIFRFLEKLTLRSVISSFI